jgi:chaperonin GroEL (HSP60 family)
LVVNKLKGTFNVLVKAPGLVTRKEMLEDIAILTGVDLRGHRQKLESRNTDLGQAIKFGLTKITAG